MTLPNFDNQLSQRVGLCKPLEDLLSNYFLIDPTVKFVANNRSRRYNDGNFPDDERPIGSVHAYKNSQHLGSVRVYKDDYRGLGRIDVYAVRSEAINKARGRSRDEVITKDAHKAIKHMQEYFRSKSNNVFRDKILGLATTEINSLRSTAQYRVTSLINNKPHQADTDVALYLLAQYEGLASALPDSINKIFSKSEDIQRFYDLRIANSVAKEYGNGGAVVIAFSDGGMWYADKSEMSDIAKITTTYDLPKNYQEKLALLKLCEPSQPVENIGVKFNQEIENDSNAKLYYLVGGETVTLC